MKSTHVSTELEELSDEIYFDVQGSGSAENVAELIAKLSAGILVLWFSFNELMDELEEYKKLRRDRKKESINGYGTQL